MIGRSTLSGPRTLAFRLPAELLTGRGPVRLDFEHPDAARPMDLINTSDDRRIALSVSQMRLYRISGDMSSRRLPGDTGVTAGEIGLLVGIPALQFMRGFVSLGDNSEFGLVQRRCGAEPVDLLRFADIELRSLLRGLADEFAELGTREDVKLTLSDGKRREYMLHERRYGLTFHTFQYEGEVDAAELLRKQVARLKVLRRKLLEDLRGGRKIFVCKRNQPLQEQEVLPPHTMLDRFRPSTLLFVTASSTAQSPGTVERLMPGLLQGTIDRFAPPENGNDLSLQYWLAICVNAYQLSRETAVAALPPAAPVDLPAGQARAT